MALVVAVVLGLSFLSFCSAAAAMAQLKHQVADAAAVATTTVAVAK
jgi:hypothetical protein